MDYTDFLEELEWPVETAAADIDANLITQTQSCHTKEVSNTTQIKDKGKGKVDTEVAHPPAKRKKQSKVWEFFDRVKGEDGKEWAICKHCEKKYPGSSKATGTSNLLKHIGRCTGTRDGDGDKPCDEIGGTTTDVLIREKVSYKSNPRSNLLNVVEKANILDTYQKEKEKLTSFINKPSSGRYNLTMNSWEDDNYTNLCLTLHFIDDGWELKSKILAFRRVGADHFFGELFGLFKSMLLEWSNVCKKMCTITTIGSKVFREIKAWLLHQHSLPLSGKFSSVCCLVDLLYTLVAIGLSMVISEDFGAHVHHIVEHKLNFRMAASHLIKEDNLFKLRESFYRLQIYLDFARDKADDYKVLKALDEAIQSLSRNQSFLTTNIYFPMVCNINRSLCELNKDEHSAISKIAKEMNKIFDSYWNNCSLVLAIAVVLDPRFKFDIVKHWFKEIYGNDAYKHCIKIRYEIEEVYDDYLGCFNSSTDHFNMLDHLGMPCTSSNNAENCKSEKSELERYLKEPKFPSVEDFDILSWWRVNTPNFPTLAKMARDFLAIRISNAESGPLFKDDIKKSLIGVDPENTEAFVCVRDWLRMPEKK